MTIRGLTFPFGASATSLPAKSTDKDTIADNITRILLTSRGSRVMRPSMGSSVYDFVFESIGSVLRARIDDEVRRAIADGEPRANVIQVDVEEITTSIGTQVTIDVAYRLNSEVAAVSVTIPRGR